MTPALLASSIRRFASSSATRRVVLDVTSLREPSVAEFLKHWHASDGAPLLLRGVVTRWPLMGWTPSDLAAKFGDVVVPVEMTRGDADYRDAYDTSSGSYADAEHGARSFVSGHEVPLGLFVECFMRTRGREGGGDDDLRAYLAQHDLFESVPELEDACRPTPPYVGAGAMKRVWIGPANTKTPLHRDPYHNVLCQVWGRKKVICYHARDESKLYPYPSGFLKNTSRVVNVDDDRGGGGDGGANAEFPDFAAASRWEIALDPGDALFLPAQTWHHVRSLTPSLSVSYWWGESRIG